MQGCYIRNLCTRQRAQRGVFFFFITFCCFFFLSSWQLHVQPEARAGCAARSRHRGSRPEHPTARKSCEKGKKKGTSSAEVAEVGSELRTVRPPAAAEHLRALSSCTSCPYKGNCGGCSPRSHCQPVPRGKKQPWDRDGKVPAKSQRELCWQGGHQTSRERNLSLKTKLKSCSGAP